MSASSSRRRYKREWELDKEFSGWLSQCMGNSTKAFCKMCKCELQAHKKDIKRHATCKKHVESMRTVQSCQKISHFIGGNISDQRKIAELKIAAFISEHCSVNTVDHLGHLIKELDENSNILKEIKLHRTKCTALINNVLSPCLFEDLMNDIGDAWYSLIIDESTTVEMKKVLCVMIRYYSQSKKKIVTTFYKLFEVEGGDATSLIKTFKAEIEQSGLKLEKLVGIGVDGANVMIGPHHSFSSLIKVNNKELVVVKCICHSLHLAAEHSCKVLPRCLDFIVKECHNWFSCSTKRQIEYNHLYKTLTDSIPLHISKLSGTRWLARYNGITKILEQWDALQLHFAIARDKERCYTAEQLYQMLKSNTNKLYFIFLKHMLEPLIETNKLFQMESADPLKLLQDVNCLLYYYIQIIVPPTALQNIAKQDIAKFPFRDYIVQTNLLNLGYSFQESSNIVDESTLKDIKQRCRDFIISLCDQLQQRVPDNITVLEKINLLSPQSATSQIRPDITDLISSFRNICQDIDVTLREWNLLHRNEWHQLDTCENFWTEVFHDKNAAGEQRYGHIAKLALALLSLPFSNATVGRAFSIVSIIKNKLRNRMAVESACNIMRIRYSLRDGGCVTFKPTPNMLERFNSENMYSCNISSEILEAFENIK